MGSVFIVQISIYTHLHFNPRFSDGERHLGPSILYERTLFQSSLPAWGASAICLEALFIACSGVLSVNLFFEILFIGVFG